MMDDNDRLNKIRARLQRIKDGGTSYSQGDEDSLWLLARLARVEARCRLMESLHNATKYTLPNELLYDYIDRMNYPTLWQRIKGWFR